MTLFWDLDAGNHEITLLKIKHLRLKERYGEGEIPYEAKTGSGPILLTFSFPYVRDWLNEHPFKNSPDSRVICNLITGAPIRPDAEDSVERKDIRLSVTDFPTTKSTHEFLDFVCPDCSNYLTIYYDEWNDKIRYRCENCGFMISERIMLVTMDGS